MKKRLCLVLVLALVATVLLYGCESAPESSAADSAAASSMAESMPASSMAESMADSSMTESMPESVPVAGAYTEEREITAEELLILTSLLTEEQQVMYLPQTVATQVVAGTNYRFYCAVMEDGSESGEFVHIVVFQSLDEDEGYSLTEIVDVQ